MASLQGLIRRVRGERVDELAAEVAVLYDLALTMNHTLHVVEQQARSTRELIDVIHENVLAVNHHVGRLTETAEEQRTVLFGLNHDVRAGAEDALPLFLGYAERLRLDTDTAIGAATVIERQLALLEGLLAAREAPEPT